MLPRVGLLLRDCVAEPLRLLGATERLGDVVLVGDALRAGEAPARAERAAP